MSDPTCAGSAYEDNCPERPTLFIYSLDGMPVYFCKEHYEIAAAWLTEGFHSSEEAEKLAEDVLRLNARMNNPIKEN